MDKYVQYMLVIALAMVAIALPEIAWAADDPCAGVLFCVTEKDISANWIKAAFPDLVNLGGTPPEEAPTGPSTLMGEALKVLNSGALAVGSLVLTYKLFAGIVQTANDGEVLGKRWSTLWGPVRVAGSAALIVPTASGYCLAQALVVSIALTGVGLANTVWNRTVDGMLTSSGNLIAPATYGHYEGMAKQVFANNVCLHLVNYYVLAMAGGDADTYNLGELDADDWGPAANWNWVNGASNPYSASAGADAVFPTNPLMYRHADWLEDDNSGSYSLAWTSVGLGATGFLDRWFGTELAANACGKIDINAASYDQVGESLVFKWWGMLFGDNDADDADESLQTQLLQLSNDVALDYAVPLFVMAADMDDVSRRIAADIIGNNVMPASRDGLDAIDDAVTSRLVSEGNVLLTASYDYGESIREGVLAQAEDMFGNDNALATEFRELAKNGGWVTAGEWFLQLMKLNGVMQNLTSMQPAQATSGIDLGAVCRTMGSAKGGIRGFFGGGGCDGDSSAAFGAAINSIQTYYDQAIMAAGRNGANSEQYRQRLNRVLGTVNELEARNESAEMKVGALIAAPTLGFLGGLLGGRTIGQLGSSILGTLVMQGFSGSEAEIGEFTGGYAGAALDATGLSINSSDTNPVSAVIALGRALWTNGLTIMLAADDGGRSGADAALIMAIGGGNFERSNVISGLVDAMGGLMPSTRGFLRDIGQMMLIPGVLLGYIFPFLPWLLWVGGLVGWFILVIEAVVAAPLWALAHMRMDGEGIMGPAGQQGYMLALSLLLRPALMIIGMLAGMMIIYIMVPFLGLSIGFTMELGRSSGATLDLMTQVMTTALMAFVTVVTCYKSFGLINDLPDRVLRWIGAGSGGAGESEFKDGAFAIIKTTAIGGAVASASGDLDRNRQSG